MFEYAQGRFLNPKRIICANIYRKKITQDASQGIAREEIRVAIDLTTGGPKPECVYAGPFTSEEHAKQFIQTLPASS
jgi:hypothetical protein